MCERGVPGGALNLSSTSYPDHGHWGDLPLQGKIPTAEPGIEPRTSWLVVRSSDDQAKRLVKTSKFQGTSNCRFSLLSHTHWIICRGSETNLQSHQNVLKVISNIWEETCNIVTVSVTQTHTCLGGLNGLPVTRAFRSRERGESGVLPGRDLSTFVAGRTLTILQQKTVQHHCFLQSTET
jgi:hypothetical protein